MTDTELFERFTGWIDVHFEELTKDLEKLVRIPSVSRYDEKDAPYGRECLRALAFMRFLAESFGFQTNTVDDRVLEISEDLSKEASVYGATWTWCRRGRAGRTPDRLNPSGSATT